MSPLRIQRVIRAGQAIAASIVIGAAGHVPSAFAVGATRSADSTASADSITTAAPDTAWYSIHLHAVRVSDFCAGSRVADITPEQVARWVERANEVYAVAHVRFEFDPTPAKGDWEEMNDTDVNNVVTDLPGDPSWERPKLMAGVLASQYPRKVLVLFRHGPESKPTGAGFSSSTLNFVVMPGFDVTTICGPKQNVFLLAHELGHYFGLSHTFRQFNTTAEAISALKAAKNDPKIFDGDGLAETPPEPYIEELQCRGDQLVILNGIPFPLLRQNVMSYYANDTKTLSPKQVEVVRQTFRNRFTRALSGVGPYVPDKRRTYQIVSLANGAALEVEKGSSEKGAAIHAAAWSGAANQSWRVLPLVASDVGAFEIVSAATGQCLTVENASTDDGARLIQWSWEGSPGQKWFLTQDEQGVLVIQAKHSRKVLTPGKTPPKSRPAAVSVTQSADRGDLTQRWRLLPAD